MAVESRSGSLSGMSDDRLGTVAVSLVVSELHLTPDVAPMVMDRTARDAVAYPEQFDRRSIAPPAPPPSAPLSSARSVRRTIGRMAVFGVILAIIVALVVVAASASAAAADLEGLYAVERGGRIFHVVTEAS